MVIQNMFVEDINRKINGVVKVDEDENKVLEQELNEYVITRELKRHFADFFNTYAEAFDEPTADTGVWISGFFGSGKSHFLKMLSYLLENKEVNGIRTVERFRKKFEDDPGTFMQVDRATKGETETILFNIDYEGSINKDKTAVLRVFAKVFYNHLGFFGSNLKVAMLEQYITQQGKMDEFCRLIEEKKGKPWTEVRKAFAFNGKFIKPALAEALDISEEDANNWFNDKSATELSVSQLVEDINAYVSTKPANFRLLFMVDEAGQYVGTDTDMLLNLQSLVEKIGSECRGKVWVVCTGQEAFTKDEWLDILLRSIGMEPDEFTEREKWLLLTRMIPLVENNFNLCELGPRSTGKSHLYKEISPNSILISGGQTTVANLFYNMGRKSVGLVGLWDCVAFDEVAGIKFKDKDGIQIMKDYMASGSFARGKEEKAASASMVFVGNINQSVDVLLKTSSLFDPFPPEMGTDTAFLDRIHCYLPGWEIPKFRPEHFTNDYGFISDYLAEFIRELRKEQYGDALDHYFRLGKNLNQRDTIAVRRMVDGYLKLMYPDGVFDKSELEEVLQISLEMRRRVKEQLKKLGGMEFYDVNFSYIDLEDMSEHYVSVPEQGGGKLIPDGMCNPGQVYTVSRGKSGMIGVFRLESQMLPGSGKFERTGLGSDRDCKESTNTAFNFLKANGKRISGGISTASKDYIINYQDLQGIGMTGKLALPTLIALCSIALGRPTVSTLAVLGEISISGTILKVDELANSLQVCLDSGAKKVLLPITSAADLGTVPPELVGSFNLIFYSSAEDAVFKALGVE